MVLDASSDSFLHFAHLPFQTVRDSPDGKPTNHEDEIPLGVSTPIDGNSLDSNAISSPHPNIPLSISRDKHEPSKSPGPSMETGNAQGWLMITFKVTSDWPARNYIGT
jgi:hypothetical protein